jgi:hypothetical protein
VTNEELKVVESLRMRGYAITIFSPEELGEACPGKIEDRMCETAWEIIEWLGGEK